MLTCTPNPEVSVICKRAGLVRSRDFTDELQPYEREAPRTVLGVLRGLSTKFSWTTPPGIRHNAL